MTEEELFINCCKSELLNNEPCCKWNERSSDEEADAEVFAEVMDEWMDDWRNAHIDLQQVKLADLLNDLNTDLTSNMKLKMTINGSNIKANQKNSDYKNLIQYFKESNKYLFNERKTVNGMKVRNLIEFKSVVKQIDNSKHAFYNAIIDFDSSDSKKQVATDNMSVSAQSLAEANNDEKIKFYNILREQAMQQNIDYAQYVDSLDKDSIERFVKQAKQAVHTLQQQNDDFFATLK